MSAHDILKGYKPPRGPLVRVALYSVAPTGVMRLTPVTLDAGDARALSNAELARDESAVLAVLLCYLPPNAGRLVRYERGPGIIGR